jgi:hypothetical protein
MISAMILPMRQIDDATVDQVVTRALKSGLIACNAMQGPFRISFFPKDRIPKGWARMGCVTKPLVNSPCVA